MATGEDIPGGTFELPGLVDMHVHLRTPGQEWKEDFTTGTEAALAGGVVTVFDMPNNTVPVTTAERLEDKIDIATRQAVADVGFYFGSLGDNIGEFPAAAELAFGLKLYLSQTTGGYLLGADGLTEVASAWHAAAPDKIIIVHAEGDMAETALEMVRRTNHPTHIAHISGRRELQAVIDAKREGLPVTCGATPHHLFLDEYDGLRLGPFGVMKPQLETAGDRDFLWDNIQYIDVVETDHAPHTIEEKLSEEPPFGVPGLETMLPLLLHAEREGKISRDKIIQMTAVRPREILGLPLTHDSVVTVIPEEYEVLPEMLRTKAGWNPFEGQLVFGRVAAVRHRGRVVYRDGQLLVPPGSGRILRPEGSV